MADMESRAGPWGGHFRATLALGLPLIGSNIAQMLTHTTDIVMLGWYGVEELAATVLAVELYFVAFIVGSGFANAVMPMVAGALGAANRRDIRRSVRMGAWITVIYCVALFPVLWFSKPIFLALGQEEHLCAMAQDYLRIAGWGLMPTLLVMVMRALFAAHQLAGIVLRATLIGAVANAISNYVFIFGNFGAPELGIQGAALSSVMTAGLSLLYLAHRAFRMFNTDEYRLFSGFWKPDWPAFRDVFRIGWPISLTLLSEVGLFSMTKVMVGWLGTLPLAAHGIVMQVTAISFMIPLGLSNVATIRASYASGSGNHGELRRGSVVVIVIALIVSLVTMSMFLAFPETLVSLFLDGSLPEAPRIVEIGVALIALAAAFQVVDAMQVVFLGLLRGLKDTAVPMLLAVISYWLIGIPAGYLIGFRFGFGAPGIWSGLVVGLAFAAVALALRFQYCIRSLKS